jgi:hypothetical protein
MTALMKVDALSLGPQKTLHQFALAAQFLYQICLDPNLDSIHFEFRDSRLKVCKTLYF